MIGFVSQTKNKVMVLQNWTSYTMCKYVKCNVPEECCIIADCMMESDRFCIFRLKEETVLVEIK